MLSVNSAYADIIDLFDGGVDVYEKFTWAKHWRAFMASGLLLAMWRGLPLLKPTPHKVIANARAFVIYVTCTICIGLIIYEWWPGLVIAIDAVFKVLEYIFDFGKDAIDYFT